MQAGEQDTQIISWRPVLSSEPFTEILIYCHSIVSYLSSEGCCWHCPVSQTKAMHCHKSIYPSGMDLKAEERRKTDLSNQSNHTMCSVPNSELSDLYKMHH